MRSRALNQGATTIDCDFTRHLINHPPHPHKVNDKQLRGAVVLPERSRLTYIWQCQNVYEEVLARLLLE